TARRRGERSLAVAARGRSRCCGSTEWLGRRRLASRGGSTGCWVPTCWRCRGSSARRSGSCAPLAATAVGTRSPPRRGSNNQFLAKAAICCGGGTRIGLLLRHAAGEEASCLLGAQLPSVGFYSITCVDPQSTNGVLPTLLPTAR